MTRADSRTTDFDATLARLAIESANINALRVVLYQLTGDEALAEMRLTKEPLRGGAYFTTGVGPEHHDEIKQRMFDYLRDNCGAPWPATPDDDETRHLIEVFVGQKWPENKLRFGAEELAMAQFPRDAQWHSKPDRAVLAQFLVVIIGAGLSGIAAGCQMKRLGIPFLLIDRQQKVGGTWHLNDYPQARVDVASNIFQYTFEKRYPWTEYFASAGETQGYLEGIVDKHGVRENLRLGVEVVAGSWDPAANRWQLVTRDGAGREEHLAANVVVSANGLFGTPNTRPEIAGLETYAGKIFHTTAWDHDFPVDGKRVALIGTGSSGAQLMPEVARRAEHLTVYQRNPQWISLSKNYRDRVPETNQWLMNHVPYYWNWARFADTAALMNYQDLQRIDREWQQAGGLVSERNDKFRQVLTDYIRDQVGDDPDLMSKCLPSYPPLVRRLVADNGWYEALRRPNVDLINTPIDTFTPEGIRTVDGEHRAFDGVILAVGFRVADYLFPVDYVGRDGADLKKAWSKDGARAFLGLMMPGFPNFLVFCGPNGQARSGTIYSWSECWSRYAAELIIHLIENDKSAFEVREDVFTEYNKRLDAEMEELIWNMPGRSYYVNSFGRQGVNMPWDGEVYHEMIVSPQLDDFEIW